MGKPRRRVPRTRTEVDDDESGAAREENTEGEKVPDIPRITATFVVECKMNAISKERMRS